MKQNYQQFFKQSKNSIDETKIILKNKNDIKKKKE